MGIYIKNRKQQLRIKIDSTMLFEHQ